MINNASSIASLAGQARPEVVDAIRQASASTGVDFSYLLQKAATESSFDTKAQAPTSSARGLYQFIDRTWLDTIDKHGAEHGLVNAAAAIKRDSQGNPVVNDAATLQKILELRDNPRVAAFMAAEFAKDNKASLEQSLGRSVGNTELYLAHFLGAGGAARFLSSMEQSPDSSAAQVMPAAARANQAVFYQDGKSLTVDQVFARFADKFDADPVPSTSQVASAPATVPATTNPRTLSLQLATINAMAALPAGPASTGLDAWQSYAESALPNRTQVQSLPMLAMRILESLSPPGESSSGGTQDWHV